MQEGAFSADGPGAPELVADMQPLRGDDTDGLPVSCSPAKGLASSLPAHTAGATFLHCWYPAKRHTPASLCRGWANCSRVE